MYQDILAKFPFKKGDRKSENSYNYVFPTLFKKVRSLQDFWYVEAEMHRLGLRANHHTERAYRAAKKRVGAK